MTKYILFKLESILHDLKREALICGRYSAPFNPKAYEKRDKSKAFKCIHYHILIRQINALTKAIVELKQED